MSASVKTSTATQYEGHIKKFKSFLIETSCPPDEVTTDTILQFLTRYTTPQYTFSYVRNLRCGILRAIKMADPKFNFDEDRARIFMKGARNRCKPEQRATVIWDAQIVLDHLSNSPRPVSIVEAAQEAVILLALAAGLRADDLWKLGATVIPHHRSFFIPFLEPQKTNKKDGTVRPGVTVAAFNGDTRICPVKAVENYLRLTADFDSRANFLFVRSDNGERIRINTLRGWLLAFLQRAGIFASPGSTRSAASSFAWTNNRTFDDIAKMTGWLRQSTFQKHYNRRVHREAINLMNDED